MTSSDPSNSPEVVLCPPARRREALLQLAAAHDPEQQAALSAAVKAMYNQPDVQWDGLWITIEAGQLVSAIWVQPLPMGRSPQHSLVPLGAVIPGARIRSAAT
mgnify:CR=1 FL=1